MTDKLDAFLEKVTAFHTAVKKQAEPCPDGQKMVDGECIPIEKTKEATMPEQPKQPEPAEKKPEEKATPAPAVAPVQAEVKTEIDTLRADMKTQAETLSAIAEKVSGLVLNAEVKGQSEVLKSMIEANQKLATALTAAQPQPQVQVKVVPFQVEKPVDMTPGFRSGNETMEDLSNRYMKRWGIEMEPETEVIPEPKPEEDPVKLDLANLKAESKAHSAAMKDVADKLSGLIATLSRNPSAPVAPAQTTPAGPVVPVVSVDKKSLAEEGMETVNWDVTMIGKGKSFDERARLIQEKYGLKENA